MDLIGLKDENWDYFREDFFPDFDPKAEDFFPENELKVEFKKFTDDFKEINENISGVVYVILQMMDNFCKNELGKKDGSLKE
mgnify:CR=1 FL=1